LRERRALGNEAFWTRSDLLSGDSAQSSSIETLQRLEEIFEELRGEPVFCSAGSQSEVSGLESRVLRLLGQVIAA
jgi:hypothetical protein